ncbi:MAG: hypothetical protein HWE25_02980 [Alphaproteobacteria bacterium]|nr:hypothetical protein [Alphaproteobacteria bacterium]
MSWVKMMFGQFPGRARRWVCAAFGIFIFALQPSAAVALDDEAGQENGCLRVANYNDEPVLQNMGEALQAIYREAGLCLTLLPMPTSRAHGLALKGLIDGQIGRTQAWIEEHDNEAFAVKPALIETVAVLFSKNQLEAGAVQDVADLVRGREIATRKATKWSAAWLEKHGGKPVYVPQWEMLPAIFAANRLELGMYLVPVRDLDAVLKNKGYYSVILEDVSVYHVLARKHAALANRLSRALDDLGGSAFVEPYLSARPKSEP